MGLGRIWDCAAAQPRSRREEEAMRGHRRRRATQRSRWASGPSSPTPMRPKGSGGAGASAVLTLLDDVPASPASRRLAFAPVALGTRHIVLSPRAASRHANNVANVSRSVGPRSEVLAVAVRFRPSVSEPTPSAWKVLNSRTGV
jgi:hypothetical protein